MYDERLKLGFKIWTYTPLSSLSLRDDEALIIISITFLFLHFTTLSSRLENDFFPFGGAADSGSNPQTIYPSACLSDHRFPRTLQSQEMP